LEGVKSSAAAESTDDYLANRDDFDREFINIDAQERLVRGEVLRRVDFEASFVLDYKTDTFPSASVDWSRAQC
jgi:hypothetical protein